MGKAFVAKLAKEGARDPEALAAWIGRKKHGGAAFKKLSAKGRKDGGDKSASTAQKPSGRTRQPSGEAAKAAPSGDQRGASGFTEAEERQLKATAAQTSKMNLGQLQAYEQAYKPGTLSTGRTREDDLRYEAVQRELKRREQAGKQIDSGLDRVRALNRGARGGSLDRMAEGVGPMRLRRMSDADVERNIQLVTALSQAAEDIDRRLDRKDASLLYNVGHALRSERARRNRTPIS